ncbi:hypothetical protein [Pseudomonas sp. 18175]|uniref:hypothetical protein n=1 Tax=Pseudomonas sp. 18175 TaxID=3390056 RepID=UPI003D1B92F9
MFLSVAQQLIIPALLPLAGAVKPLATQPPSPKPITADATNPPPSAARSLRGLLADNDNLRLLASKLMALDSRVYGRPVPPGRVAYSLNANTMSPVKDSSYAAIQPSAVTLAAAISGLGFKLPTTIDEVVALKEELEQKASLHPLGDFGGGLSWPKPMSKHDQQSIVNYLDTQKPTAKPGEPTATLAYLLSGSSVMPSDLQDPVGALQKLLDSPKARELGLALQTQLKGAPSPIGVYDYVLTALHLGLDPESLTTPVVGSVAGFELAKPEHWGKSPATVVENLSKHLVDKGRTTSDSAKLASHLLLARTAPQYLIEDIPASVTVGSLAWANLSIAAAAVEAERPGTVANMTFADVMSYAARNTPSPSAPETAKNAALVEWALANGLLTKSDAGTYTPAQINELRAAFTKRSNELISASQAMDNAILSRKDIALTRLKEIFGDLGPLFEEKVLTSTDDRVNDRALRREDGTLIKHSMLDIAMMDLGSPWVHYQSSDPRIPIDKVNNSQSDFGVSKSFETWFSTAMTHKRDAVTTTVQHLISQLPLEDRKNFEYGKITLYQQTSYALNGFIGTTPAPTDPELLVKIEREGQTQTYEINFNAGTIKHTPAYRAKERQSREANWVYETKEFKPDSMKNDRSDERPSEGQALDSFNSLRSYRIGNALVEHLGLYDPSIKEAALGKTTLETSKDRYKPLNDFLLNLIPFRSAILNFQKGDIGAGLFDLTLDVFGFVTAGVAAGGKLLKIGSTALSTSTKALQAAKVIGAAALSGLNPLGGLDDLAKGGMQLLDVGAELAVRKARETINKLKGATGSYDLLKAANKEFGPTLIGTYKQGSNSVEGVAVLKNNKWYSYDPVLKRPYGPAIDYQHFTPLNSPLLDSSLHKHLDAFEVNMVRSKSAENLSQFDQGYKHGNLQQLKDYSGQTSLEDLLKLAAKPDRAPDEIGILARVVEHENIERGRYFTSLLASDVAGPGVSIDRFTQLEYLARVDLTSTGDCAGLVNAMALALQRGDEKIFLANLNKVSTSASHAPQHIKFNADLKHLQNAVDKKHSFHMGSAPSRDTAERIINQLTRATKSTYLRISTQDHALLAGVRFKDNKKEWFFFEPNGGLVKFDNLESMQKGMAKVLDSGAVSATLKPHVTSLGTREFLVSPFHPDDLVTEAVDSFAVSLMVSNPLPA